jgi:hypothetical protein
MFSLTSLAIIASGLLFGQLQSSGADPDERKRGEKMIALIEKQN